MSGTASFVATVKAVWMGNSGSGTWTLTDNANASIGLLPTSQASDSELILHFKRVDAMAPAQSISNSATTSVPVRGRLPSRFLPPVVMSVE